MKDALRILVLEDDDNDVELIRRCLSKEFPAATLMRVKTRASFETALGQRDYDLILSDNTLPGFSGTAALTLVRQRGIDCPFIFFSGTVGERPGSVNLQQDADACLSNRAEDQGRGADAPAAVVGAQHARERVQPVLGGGIRLGVRK